MARMLSLKGKISLSVFQAAVLTVALMGAFYPTGSAHAITIGFNPVSQEVVTGTPFNVDIVISGLGAEIVSAFDLDVNYDPSILSATGVSFSLLLGGDPSFQFSDVSMPGLVDLAELSLLSDFELGVIQPDSFTLATLAFNPLLPGVSPLSFTFNPFNDVKGSNALVLNLDPGTGNVTVAPVPEPGTLLLLGSGLLGLVGRFRSKKHLVA